MTVERPTTADIRAIAEGFGYRYGDDEFAEVHALAAGGLAAYDVVDELYAEHIAVTAPRRAYDWPAAAENPLGAWYVTSDIAPTGSGA